MSGRVITYNRRVKPSCPHGFTNADLIALFNGSLLEAAEFKVWMSGQTVMLCEGKTYVHHRGHNAECGHSPSDIVTWQCPYLGTGHYEEDACHNNPHGVVTYVSDVQRYLAGLPVID